MNKATTQADTGPQVQPGEERRRSQRVIISVPVTLEMTVAGKRVTIRAMTASVNDHGAMIICNRNLSADTIFELIHDRSEHRQICRVTRTAVENQQGYLIPVEFAEPSPGFWHISFPAPGWKALEN